jgi:hypothetical protein
MPPQYNNILAAFKAANLTSIVKAAMSSSVFPVLSNPGFYATVFAPTDEVRLAHIRNTVNECIIILLLFFSSRELPWCKKV